MKDFSPSQIEFHLDFTPTEPFSSKLHNSTAFLNSIWPQKLQLYCHQNPSDGEPDQTHRFSMNLLLDLSQQTRCNMMHCTPTAIKGFKKCMTTLTSPYRCYRLSCCAFFPVESFFAQRDSHFSHLRKTVVAAKPLFRCPCQNFASETQFLEYFPASHKAFGTSQIWTGDSGDSGGSGSRCLDSSFGNLDLA